VNHVTAALLDLANIVGGFLLASALLIDLPRVGPGIGRVAARVARVTAVVGVLALVMGGYYLIVHLANGPHVFHFELVGIGVGVALLRERLFPRTGGAASASRAGLAAGPTAPIGAVPAAGPTVQAAVSGGALLLAVFGLIAVVVGIQGLFTPDG
jgi:hypothetical protein